MTVIRVNEYTQEFDLVDQVTGEVYESTEDLAAAVGLCRLYNSDE